MRRDHSFFLLLVCSSIFFSSFGAQPEEDSLQRDIQRVWEQYYPEAFFTENVLFPDELPPEINDPFAETSLLCNEDLNLTPPRSHNSDRSSTPTRSEETEEQSKPQFLLPEPMNVPPQNLDSDIDNQLLDGPYYIVHSQFITKIATHLVQSEPCVNNNRHVCKVCNKGFCHRSNLLIHISNVHIPAYPFYCKFPSCNGGKNGFCVKSRGNLKAHIYGIHIRPLLPTTLRHMQRKEFTKQFTSHWIDQYIGQFPCVILLQHELNTMLLEILNELVATNIAQYIPNAVH